VDLQIKNSTGDPPRLRSSEQMRSVGQESRKQPVGRCNQNFRRKYLDSFLAEAISAALPAEWDVECTCESARVLTTVTSLARDLPNCRGINVIIDCCYYYYYYLNRRSSVSVGRVRRHTGATPVSRSRRQPGNSFLAHRGQHRVLPGQGRARPPAAGRLPTNIWAIP